MNIYNQRRSRWQKQKDKEEEKHARVVCNGRRMSG
ncbi:unnamed protein product [Brassica oleracea]